MDALQILTRLLSMATARAQKFEKNSVILAVAISKDEATQLLILVVAAMARTHSANSLFFNPPYYEGKPRDAADQAWRGIDLSKRLVSELSEHLRPDGSALVASSSDADEKLFVQALESRGFRVEVIAERPLVNETLRIYRAERANSC